MTDFHDPAPTTAGGLGISRGTSFAAYRLDFAAVAALLWFLFFCAAVYIYIYNMFFFSLRTRAAYCMNEALTPHTSCTTLLVI